MSFSKLKQKLFQYKARWINPILLRTKYRNRSKYCITLAEVTTCFLTEDYYSKSWFYPRYDNGRYHEPALTQMLLKDFQQANTFMDIGAHLGFYTCIAGRIMKNGVVVGFEMDKLCAELASNNVAHNCLENSIVRNVAVTSQPSLVRYKANAQPNAGLSIAPNISHDFIEVPSVSVDSYCEDHKITPDLIKIDVEGAEMEVLKGMKETLGNSPKIYIELHEKQLPKFHSSILEVISFLHSHHFNVYEIMEHRNNLQPSLRLITLDTLPLGNPMVVAVQE